MRGAAPFPPRQLYLWGCRGFNSAESRSNERPVTSHKLVHLAHKHTCEWPHTDPWHLLHGVWWSCPSKCLRHELQPKEGPSMITQKIESYVAIRNNVCSVINTCPSNALMLQAMVRKPLILTVQVQICLLSSPTYSVTLFPLRMRRLVEMKHSLFLFPYLLSRSYQAFCDIWQ